MAFVAQTSGETDPGRMTMLVAVITLAEAMEQPLRLVSLHRSGARWCSPDSERWWQSPDSRSRPGSCQGGRALVAPDGHCAASARRRNRTRRRRSRARPRGVGRERLRQGCGDIGASCRRIRAAAAVTESASGRARWLETQSEAHGAV